MIRHRVVAAVDGREVNRSIVRTRAAVVAVRASVCALGELDDVVVVVLLVLLFFVLLLLLRL